MSRGCPGAGAAIFGVFGGLPIVTVFRRSASMICQYGWQTFIGLCLLLWAVLIMAIRRVAGGAFALADGVGDDRRFVGRRVNPNGGGTIAFPALVLGFKESPAMARDFGLAIQSIGMTSALLFIVMRGIPVERAC